MLHDSLMHVVSKQSLIAVYGYRQCQDEVVNLSNELDDKGQPLTLQLCRDYCFLHFDSCLR